MIDTSKPISRLQAAIDKVMDLGLPFKAENAQPLADIASKLAAVDGDKTLVIARTISSMQAFDRLVSDQLAKTNYSDRFNSITEGFDSIIEDARRQVAQEEKGGPDFGDRIGNVYMKITRGDVADRFARIEELYSDVIEDAGKTIALQTAILEAYSDARLALKDGEIAALELFEAVKVGYEAAKRAVNEANARIDALGVESGGTERAKLELARDEAVIALRKEDERYQVAKDLAEMLKVSYAVTETTFDKYHQSNQVLDRLYKKAVMFFNVQRPVMTAMKASFTGLMVVGELSRTQSAMEAGMNKSLEALASLSDVTLREGVRVAHGPAFRAESVRKLVESIVDFQEESAKIVAENRQLATQEAEAIRVAVEDGKRRMTELLARPL